MENRRSQDGRGRCSDPGAGPVGSAVLAVLALGLFLFHTLSLTQALLLMTAGVLRSRRFRDLMMILIPLFWMGYYILSRSLSRQVVRIKSMRRQRQGELNLDCI